MPLGAHQECRFARCPRFAVANGYCQTHAELGRPQRYEACDRRLNSANKQFRHLRLPFLRTHPICAMCQREPATVLDHIRPHRGIAQLFWDQANWQSLCRACHGVKTAGELLSPR